MQQPIMIVESTAPNVVLRVVYFLGVGWWLGGLVSALAWILNLTVIGLPAGLWLINRLPSMITLRPQGQTWQLEGAILKRGIEQRPFWLRALYFVVVGSWFSGLWMLAAYCAMLTLILIPIAFWMYGRIGAITTLFRS